MSSTLVLSMGGILLVSVRLSGNASALGLVVLVALVLVAIGCGLHLTALIGTLPVRRPFRVLAGALGWLVLASGSAWVVERAPGGELVSWLILVPIVIGALGLRAPRPDRWAAIAFMGVAVGLAALLLPVWIERQAI